METKNTYQSIGIIGGGASGLAVAILLARQGFAVTILEKNDKIGKKLLTTGNGRCNISNRHASARHYFSRTKNLAEHLLKKFPVQMAMDFFESIGITVKELEKGKLYPYSLEAKTVVKAFLYEIEHLGISVVYGANVTKLEKQKQWQVSYSQKIAADNPKEKEDGKNKAKSSNQKQLPSKRINKKQNFDKIVLCTGGMSYAVSGSDGSGYALAKSLGHTIIEPLAAIVQLVMNEKQFPYYKHLSGTKTETRLRLLDQSTGEVLRTETEELLFTAYGISGPAVLLLSTNNAYAQAKKRKTEVAVNFFPEMTTTELERFIASKIKQVPHFSIEHMLEMFLPNRLIGVALKQTEIASDKKAEAMTDKEVQRLIKFLTDLRLQVVSSYQWQQAQVTAGGVSCHEVKENSLESLKASGLYLAGEVLDIDGDCGGFNLQWAWTSAMAVAKDIQDKRGYEDK